MSFVIKIGILFLNILYSILKIFPMEKKIVYISRELDKPSVDFLLLKADIEKRYPDYKNVILCKTLKKGIVSKFKYILHMFRQMYHIATAQAVILDTYCIAVSILRHRKSLLVIQMWHALGALKKFGYSIVDKPEGTSKKIAKALKMHYNYSYVFASSEYCRKFFSEAFAQSIDTVKIFPLPRVDLFYDSTYKAKVCRKIYSLYPRLYKSKKKIIVYAPTFRKEISSPLDEIQQFIDAVDYDNYELIVKLHPIEQIKYKNLNAIFDTHFSSFEMFYVADIIISDYSAVIFEGMLFRKPIYLYAFDYKTYNRNREFYVDYQRIFDGLIYTDCAKLLESIDQNSYREDITENILEKMIQRKEKSYTESISDFIIHSVKQNQELNCERGV